jgi:hypothetical protein
MDGERLHAQVRSILEHAGEHPWTLQDIGLLGLWLDDRRECRLHVWGPADAVGDPPIHDHPFDFTSTVLAGAITNTRYEVSDDGLEYQRTRYVPDDEDARTSDTVRLSGTAARLRTGDRYSQRAHELHDSRQVAGTVTIIRTRFVDVPVLTVCQPVDAPWVSGRSRRATEDDVARIAAPARDLLAAADANEPALRV